MALSLNDLHTRARRIRLLLFDVDGVLTDGTVFLHGDGYESKGFFIRDGAAIIWARQAGLEVGLLSGRPSPATTRRADELGISIVIQGGPDKRQPFAQLLTSRGFAADEVAYMGDDLLDLPVLMQVGLSAAPADAASDVKARVHWVSARDGGRGAVRDLIELVLRAREEWLPLVDRHLD